MSNVALERTGQQHLTWNLNDILDKWSNVIFYKTLFQTKIEVFKNKTYSNNVINK